MAMTCVALPSYAIAEEKHHEDLPRSLLASVSATGIQTLDLMAH
ncbi:hypothetical protein JCM19239_7055 [Vibrio variabilis]|uniref:Uncharacterized protein n=1 Tax=Vibrio variabilis TaxID=990271 RepID=A0ABQ0JNA8_9VIBR|nr:hypothetical protein JCM19239_7055 [Vibrio variabilis]